MIPAWGIAPRLEGMNSSAIGAIHVRFFAAFQPQRAKVPGSAPLALGHDKHAPPGSRTDGMPDLHPVVKIAEDPDGSTNHDEQDEPGE
jgi:hypothetical protein